VELLEGAIAGSVGMEACEEVLARVGVVRVHRKLVRA
jgi:hypothetical protein